MEMQSDKLDKITPALIGARKEIYGAVKKGKGNWGAYASLEDIIEAINEPLLNHDIFVSQAGCSESGVQYILTQATHVSGQFMRSYTKVELQQAGNPQKALASQTYTRRAGMEALFNIPRVDDDGEHGNGGNGKQEKMIDEFANEVEQKLSTEQQNELVEVAVALDIPFTDVTQLITEHGYKKAKEIPVSKLDFFKDKLKQLAEQGVENVS